MNSDLCPYCGCVVGSGPKGCPICGKYYANAQPSNAGGAGDALGGLIGNALGPIVVILIAAAALPVVIFNPLVTGLLMFKSRLFNFSRVGRWLAFLGSFVYTAWIIYLFIGGVAHPEWFNPTFNPTLLATQKVLIYGIGAVFGAEILYRAFRLHDFRRGFIHLAGCYALLVAISASTTLLFYAFKWGIFQQVQ
ncbi:hypothetical protein [Lacticaseibacillus parakribbianus]|uniref:hypothetical protein n=1 Tax=Lacticaseibacillus parakribbianus TaxID=2970927 RepID=UPI0021CB64E5|nr:hypothetical protein [Lacticaseibacillus parakribbianus]